MSGDEYVDVHTTLCRPPIWSVKFSTHSSSADIEEQRTCRMLTLTVGQLLLRSPRMYALITKPV